MTTMVAHQVEVPRAAQPRPPTIQMIRVTLLEVVPLEEVPLAAVLQVEGHREAALQVVVQPEPRTVARMMEPTAPP